MKETFSNLLKILTGFLHLLIIMAKPHYRDTSIVMPQETEYQSQIQSSLRLPPINLNIIVVPVVREVKAEENLVDLLNNRMELLGNKNNEKFVASVATDNMEPMTERLVDFGSISSSNEIDDTEENKTPAPGIIQPQRELPQSPVSMCKPSEVYDSGLGQCIRRRSGSCPLCGRIRG